MKLQWSWIRMSFAATGTLTQSEHNGKYKKAIIYRNKTASDWTKHCDSAVFPSISLSLSPFNLRPPPSPSLPHRSSIVHSNWCWQYPSLSISLCVSLSGGPAMWWPLRSTGEDSECCRLRLHQSAGFQEAHINTARLCVYRAETERGLSRKHIIEGKNKS